jgi:hypothetical protein
MDISDTAAGLEALVETCADGEQTFFQCAADADDMALQVALTRCASTWHRRMNELRSLCSTGPVVPVALDSGSPMQTIRNDASLLAHCERFEHNALQRYRQMLELDVPRVTRAVLQRHVDGIRVSRTQLRSLHTAMEQHAA